jgi:hypothetical protein
MDSKLNITNIILINNKITKNIFNINNLELDNSLEVINKKKPRRNYISSKNI